jgi:hypothetical protein
MWADGNACAVGTSGDQFLRKLKVRDDVCLICAQLFERKETGALVDGVVAYRRCWNLL